MRRASGKQVTVGVLRKFATASGIQNWEARGFIARTECARNGAAMFTDLKRGSHIRDIRVKVW